jgi:hypothetical protein
MRDVKPSTKDGVSTLIIGYPGPQKVKVYWSETELVDKSLPFTGPPYEDPHTSPSLMMGAGNKCEAQTRLVQPPRLRYLRSRCTRHVEMHLLASHCIPLLWPLALTPP